MRPGVTEDLEGVRRLADGGELVSARRTLEALTAHRVAQAGGHLECGEAAMELGLLKLADRELQLELRDLRSAPDTTRALSAVRALAEICDALGDVERAHGYRVLEARAMDRPPPPPPRADPLGRAAPPSARPPAAPAPPRPTPSPPRATATDGLLAPSPADLVRFLHLYAGRDDVHARQWRNADGRAGYSPISRPLTVELLASHLGGEQTLGVYQSRIDGTVAFFALDLDVIKPALERARRDPEEARNLRRSIAQAGLNMVREARRFGLELVLEDSGYKGRHAWGFFAEPLPAGLVRKLVKALSRAVGPADARLMVECFPKQDQLGPDQIGNLIKLPLGIHLKTGRRAHLLGPDGAPAADPWALLRGARRLTRDDVLDALARLRDVTLLAGEPGEREDGVRAPAPLSAEAEFTEADFEANGEVRAMLAGCPVLATLVARGLERRRLVHEEQVVLRHTLGHFAVGTRAVNYVFSRCPEIGGDMMLKSVLAGNPMSCPKIRKRIPEVTSRVACNCAFRVRADHYPTPVLHVDEARARGELRDRESAGAAQGSEAPTAEVTEDLARRYWHLRERVERLGRELAACEADLMRTLEGLPDERLEDAEGVLWLERPADGAGPPQVRWRAATAPDAADG